MRGGGGAWGKEKRFGPPVKGIAELDEKHFEGARERFFTGVEEKANSSSRKGKTSWEIAERAKKAKMCGP